MVWLILNFLAGMGEWAFGTVLKSSLIFYIQSQCGLIKGGVCIHSAMEGEQGLTCIGEPMICFSISATMWVWSLPVANSVYMEQKQWTLWTLAGCKVQGARCKVQGEWRTYRLYSVKDFQQESFREILSIICAWNITTAQSWSNIYPVSWPMSSTCKYAGDIIITLHWKYTRLHVVVLTSLKHAFRKPPFTWPLWPQVKIELRGSPLCNNWAVLWEAWWVLMASATLPLVKCPPSGHRWRCLRCWRLRLHPRSNYRGEVDVNQPSRLWHACPCLGFPTWM